MKRTAILLYLLVILCSCEVRPLLGTSPILVSRSVKEADSLKTLVCEYRQVCPIEYTDSIVSFRMETRYAFVEKVHTRVALFPPFPDKYRMKIGNHYQFVAIYDTATCYETIRVNLQHEHRNNFDLVVPRVVGPTFRNNMIFEFVTDTSLGDTICFPIEYSPTYWRYSKIEETISLCNVCDSIVFVKVN